jgi:hypothetical protein
MRLCTVREALGCVGRHNGWTAGWGSWGLKEGCDWSYGDAIEWAGLRWSGWEAGRDASVSESDDGDERRRRRTTTATNDG